jgi:hypothetical protein
MSARWFIFNKQSGSGLKAVLQATIEHLRLTKNFTHPGLCWHRNQDGE